MRAKIGVIVTILLATAIGVVYFVFGFPITNSDSNSTSLRGNATVTEDINDIPDIDPDGVNGVDQVEPKGINGTEKVPQGTANETEVEDEGEFFVTRNDTFTLAPTGEDTKIPNYDAWEWDDLPQHIKDAASLLGYTKEDWDSSEKIDTTERKWSDLTRIEKNAARSIGYTKRYWNRDIFDTESTLYPSQVSSTYPYVYASFLWSELPEDIRSAAEYLGYTHELWDNSKDLPLQSKKWGELTAPQRAAAEELGFDEEVWNSFTR